jgi:uncharacterized membrane protein YfcA
VFEVAGAVATGLGVGLLSAVAGIGGGVLMVPFLYLVYAPTGLTLSAQTVVAHATSLGVAFVTSAVGTWRYARARAVQWPPALVYAVPGIVTAFVTARILTKSEETHWVRAAFATFLLVSAWDMWRRSRKHHATDADEVARAPHSWFWLAATGAFGGVMAALLGIGGGLIAVPVLLYVGRLPVRAVAPTALAGVTLTTLSGGLGYLTAGPGPQVSQQMAGFLDLRMLLPLSIGAVLTVPLGVRVNRTSQPETLYRIFAGVFALIGLWILVDWLRG